MKSCDKVKFERMGKCQNGIGQLTSIPLDSSEKNHKSGKGQKTREKKKRIALSRIRGVHIVQSQRTVNKSWSTAVCGGRGSIIAMNIVNSWLHYFISLYCKS